MLKEDSIKRRIHHAFEKHDVLKDASKEIRDYFEELIRLTYQNLEMDDDAYNYTSSENLRFAIDVTIYDDFGDIYEEAKRETQKDK